MALATVSATKFSVHSRATFVRDAVKVIPLTQRIIDSIMPFFPLSCKVIGGYLDDHDQYWKVNFHWENLVTKIETFMDMKGPSEKHKTMARAIWKVLMSNPPLPERGYLKDKHVGDTRDLSPLSKTRERHKLLKQSKKDFREIIIAAEIVDPLKEKGNPPKAEKPWWLAVAPLAPPGHSKHGTGYAQDIAGDNDKIVKIAKQLGATLVFPEASHIHVEFGEFQSKGLKGVLMSF
jgi:hypothetical protein